MPRWHLCCDTCDVAAWIGPAGDRLDVWCEGCQRAATVPLGTTAMPCPRCALGLDLGAPRFEELYGAVQELAAVLSAWGGDAAALGRLLPERPRYLSDLTPPETRGDDEPTLREALETLAHGRFAHARDELTRALESSARVAREPRAWLALGIAAQRVGELPLAEAAYTRVLELEPAHVVARLDRGALRARRGDYPGAREDLSLAGDRHEARWDRAAARVLEAVSFTPGLPERALIEQARAEAGPASSYWSDHTVGRLLMSALLERARTRMDASGAACADARVLRAAAAELEFDTFWDRALVLHGFASLGLGHEAAECAAAVAYDQLAALAAEPAVAGAAGAAFAPALRAVERAVMAADPASARAAIDPLLEREDLRHYRVPCLGCGRGSLGVDQLDEDAAEPDEPA